jgi:hypothetical protein
VWKKLLPFYQRVTASRIGETINYCLGGALGTLPLKYGMSNIPWSAQAALSNHKETFKTRIYGHWHKIHNSEKSEDNLSPVNGIESVKNKYASLRSIENHGGKGHWKAFTTCLGWSYKFWWLLPSMWTLYVSPTIVCNSSWYHEQNHLCSCTIGFQTQWSI